MPIDERIEVRMQLLEQASARHERVLYGRYDETTGRREMGLVDALPAIRLFPRFAVIVVALLGLITAREILTADAWAFFAHMLGGK